MNSLNFWHCPQACYSMSLMTICLEWGLLGWLAIILLAALSAFPLSVSILPPPSLPSSLLPFLSHFTTSCIQQEREQGHVRQSEVKAGCGRVEFVLISFYTNISECRTSSKLLWLWHWLKNWMARNKTGNYPHTPIMRFLQAWQWAHPTNHYWLLCN